eukprot:g38983.t1
MIRDSQHGFVQGKSCLTNLLEFFQEVIKKIDEGRAVDIVYLDFSTAFDKVPHGKLISQVRSHGIQACPEEICFEKMKLVLVVLICLGTIFFVALAGPTPIRKNCCRKYSKSIPDIKNIKGYRIQENNGRCRIKAV